jgi:hypothetical protein
MRTSLVVVMLVYYEVKIMAVLQNEYELNLILAVLYSH